MVEHVASLHGHEPPAWVDEPERFLDSTLVLSPILVIRMESLMFAPAGFLRHGAIPDPRDVDARIDAGHSRLTEAVRRVGRRHGLGDSWLNEQATTAMPHAADVRARMLYGVAVPDSHGRVGQAPVDDEVAGWANQGPRGRCSSERAPGTEGYGGGDPDLQGVAGPLTTATEA